MIHLDLSGIPTDSTDIPYDDLFNAIAEIREPTGIDDECLFCDEMGGQHYPDCLWMKVRKENETR